MKLHTKEKSDLMQWIGEINTIPASELVRRREWGTVTFDSVEPQIRTVQDALKRVTADDLDALTQKQQNEAKSYVKGFRDSVQKLRGFSLGMQGASIQEAQAAFTQEIDRAADNINVVLPPLLMIVQQRESATDPYRSQFQGMIQQLSSSQQAATEDAKKIADILKAAETASSNIGVEKYANLFGAEERKFRKQARSWLCITLGFAIFTFVIFVWGAPLLIYVQPWISDENMIPKSAQLTLLIISKLILVSGFVGATLWCGRMYKTMKHQEAINSHRSRALAIFRTFHAGAQDPAIKDAILAEATRSIFAITSPGYFGDNSENESGLKIIEVLKSVVPG